MPTRIQSSLFARIFATTAAVISVLFAIMYLLAVPFIQNTVAEIEKNAGRTILKNVYDMVEQTHQDLENFRQSIIMERKAQLYHIIEVVEARVRILEEQVLTGKLSKEQAISTLLEELRHIKYGRDDYVWAANYSSVLISHPDPQLNNADFSKMQDLHGNLIVPPMVAGARQNGEGFHSYWWRRLGEEQATEKLTYYKHVPALDLVIGTGVYLDDVEAAVRLKKDVAIKELRQRLRTTHLAKSGYVYIFDGRQNMVIHPNPNIEGKDFSKQLNPSSQTPIGPL
jgi:signal transduction histidine kinase